MSRGPAEDQLNGYKKTLKVCNHSLTFDFNMVFLRFFSVVIFVAHFCLPHQNYRIQRVQNRFIKFGFCYLFTLYANHLNLSIESSASKRIPLMEKNQRLNWLLA